jgi:hypothetical protein
MTSNVVPADDDLVYALTNIARGLKYGPDQAWIEEAIETIASLSSELARCRNALKEVEYTISAWALAHDIDGAARNDLLKRLRESQSNASDAALNPIVEEGAREP